MDQSVTGLNDHTQSPALPADHGIPPSSGQHEGANTSQDLAPSSISASAGQQNVGSVIVRQNASPSGEQLQGRVSTNHRQNIIRQHMIEGGMLTSQSIGQSVVTTVTAT